MKKLLALGLLLGSSAAFAEAGGYVNGGFSLSSYNGKYDDGFELDLDPGRGFNLQGGVRFSPGIDVRLSFDQVKHDGGDALDDGNLLFSFDDEVTISEFRLGVYFAPPPKRTVGFRVGGGYIRQSFKIEGFGSDTDTANGLFGEGAVLIDAGKVVTFDLGGTLFVNEHDEDGTSVGVEAHAMAVFHAGPVDIGAGYRYQAINTQFDDDDNLDESIGELRLTIGGSWGFPKAP